MYVHMKRGNLVHGTRATKHTWIKTHKKKKKKKKKKKNKKII